MILFSLETQIANFVSVKKKPIIIIIIINYNTELHFRRKDTDVLFSGYLHQVYFILLSKHTMNLKTVSPSI